MNLFDRLRRWVAPNAIHRQLFPRPSVDFRLRPYREPDRDAMLGLYDANAPDRFPEPDRLKFERFLDSDPESDSYFVAESAGGEIVACGGVSLLHDRVNVLSYGLVSPEHQGRGVGSALALARLTFATRVAGQNFSLIFAVPKSLGFYHRFGYVEVGAWDGDDGKQYPAAGLGYAHDVFEPIESILEERGLLIDPSLPIAVSNELEAVLEEDLLGVYDMRIERKEPE